MRSSSSSRREREEEVEGDQGEDAGLPVRKRSRHLTRKGRKLGQQEEGDERVSMESVAEKREHMKQVLHERRAKREKEVSLGEWCFAEHMVRVFRERGVVSATMGSQRSQFKYLQPEEALFLLDRGTLKFSVGETVVDSLQLGFMHILTHSKVPFSMHHFAAYSFLRRLGFVVKRHDSSLYKVASPVEAPVKRSAQNRIRKHNAKRIPLPLFEFSGEPIIVVDDGEKSAEPVPIVKDSLLAQLTPCQNEKANLERIYQTLSVVQLSKPCVEQVGDYFVYDVWKSGHFERSRKKPQNRPTFAVLIVNIAQENEPLPLPLINKLQEELKPTPIYVAAVNASNVSFLQIETSFELPLAL